jgi:hypothetical protein
MSAVRRRLPVVLALRSVVLALVAWVGCAGTVVGCTAAPSSVAAPVVPAVSARPVPSPTRSPIVNTDGCQGLVTAAQVSKASGLPVEPSAGDAAGAAGQYRQAMQGLGLTATVRMCAFGDGAGDQVTILGMAFPDPGQAGRFFATGQSVASFQPVGGVGEAAVSDRSKTLLARRGKAVVAVYLVAVASPDGDHLGPLRSVATAALTKA